MRNLLSTMTPSRIYAGHSLAPQQFSSTVAIPFLLYCTHTTLPVSEYIHTTNVSNIFEAISTRAMVVVRSC